MDLDELRECACAALTGLLASGQMLDRHGKLRPDVPEMAVRIGIQMLEILDAIPEIEAAEIEAAGSAVH